MEKNDNNVDKMIKQNLEAGPPGMEIDIRRETMSRIEAYEGKREKVKNVGLWIVSLFVFCAGLLSIFLFEGLIVYFENLFMQFQLDTTVIKFGFQGVFLVFVLISLTVMISQIRPAKHLSRFMFMLSF
jgi:hypothetical protein